MPESKLATEINSMEIEVIAFGIAKDIVKGKQVKVSLDNDSTIGAARRQLSSDFPEFGKLASLRFAVNTEYVDDNYELQPDDEVVLIPPVSGG